MSLDRQFLIPGMDAAFSSGAPSISQTHPDLDLDPEYGLGTTGARVLDSSLNQGFELASKLDPGTQDFWFAGWVKPNNLTADMQILGDSGGDGITINASTGTIKVVDMGVATTISTTGLVANEWQHLVILLDRANDLCKVYINGQLDKSTTALVNNPRSHAAKQSLIDDHGWTITDGGQA